MAAIVDSQLIQDAIGIIVIVGGTLVYAKSRIPTETIKNLQQLTNTYERRITALEAELKENHKLQLANIANISDLQGQVKVYKELPLQELADGMKEIVAISKENATSNQEILKTLKATAEINAQDRDILTTK